MTNVQNVGSPVTSFTYIDGYILMEPIDGYDLPVNEYSYLNMSKHEVKVIIYP